MKLSRKLLEEFIDLRDLSDAEIVNHFIELGFECESIDKVAEGTNLEVGKILSVEKVEKSEKLHKCMVETSKGVKQIICGAKNVVDASYVIVALEGAKLPGGITIKKSKLAGFDSEGMICSLNELGLMDNFYEAEEKELDGIKIIEEGTVGEDPFKLLGYDDTIFDFEIYSNRGDMQGAFGFSKELSAKLNRPLKKISLDFKESNIDNISLKVESEKVTYYSLSEVSNIKNNETPNHIKNILKGSGIIPRNLIIDLSNYVMLEFGVPLHTFDKDKLNKNEIIIKESKNEDVQTIFEDELNLESDLVITSNDKVLAVAGVIGLKEAMITDDTKNIIIEAARFDKDTIRKTSRKLIQTEASRRFEKDFSPALVELAMKRFLHLIELYGKGTVSNKIISFEKDFFENPKITIDQERISKFLGHEVTLEEITEVLEKLDFVINDNVVQAPSYRTDIVEECDIVEEILRFMGLDMIKASLPNNQTFGGKPRYLKKIDSLKERLLGSGFSEVITYSLVKDKTSLKVQDSISKDKVYIRNTLIPSLINLAAYNQRREVKDVFIFEVSNIYQMNGENLEEETKLGILASGNIFNNFDMKSKKVNYYYMKSILEDLLNYLGLNNRFSYKEGKVDLLNIYQTEELLIDKRNSCGYLGEVDPRVLKNTYVIELNLTKLLNMKVREIKHKDISEYPSIEKDVTFDVTNTIIEDILTVLRKNIAKDLKEIIVFDNFEKNNIKTASFKLRFNSEKRTLKDKDINDEFLKAVENVEKTLNTTRR